MAKLILLGWQISCGWQLLPRTHRCARPWCRHGRFRIWTVPAGREAMSLRGEVAPPPAITTWAYAKSIRGDRTPLELFLGGIRGWEASSAADLIGEANQSRIA
jgi:hypothetical protein